MSDIYNSELKGEQVDESVKSSYLTVADITARNALDTNLFTTGKVVEVLDNGSGIKQKYEWNGSGWDDYVEDLIKLSDGAVLESEDGNLSIVQKSTGDDKGWCLNGGQLEVPDSEIIAGSDSTPPTLAFLYNTANETGTTITGATDILTIIESDTGSTTPMFESNVAGDCLVIGFEVPFYGVKMKYGSNGTLEPQNIIGEYLNNVNSWETQTFMVTNANSPYNSVGWNLSSFVQEHVRFGQSLRPDFVPDWGSQTLNINGTNYTRFFARIRLTTPITSVPQIEQIKQHPSRIELNSGGLLEFFGDSRCNFTLQAGVSNLINNTSSSPSNQAVTYFNSSVDGDDVTAGYTDNQFNNNTIDGVIITQPFIEALDTSTPLLLGLSFYVENGNTGDVEFVAEYQQVSDGFLYNQSISPQGSTSEISTISTSSTNVRRSMLLEVPINEIGTEGGGVLIHLTRDARTANLNDTYQGNVVLTNFEIRGRRWRV